MKLMSWNVNGLRAVVKKGFTDQIEATGSRRAWALQETKAQDDQVREALFGLGHGTKCTQVFGGEKGIFRHRHFDQTSTP